MQEVANCQSKATLNKKGGSVSLEKQLTAVSLVAQLAVQLEIQNGSFGWYNETGQAGGSWLACYLQSSHSVDQ